MLRWRSNYNSFSYRFKIPLCNFKWVSRYENNHADSLINLGQPQSSSLDGKSLSRTSQIPVQQPIGEVLRFDTSPGLRDPIIAYLKDGTLLDDRAQARKLQHLVTRYILLGDVLYKKSYSSLHSDPYLKCCGPDEARKVMQEIHDGDYRNHAEGRFLAHKVNNQGYY